MTNLIPIVNIPRLTDAIEAMNKKAHKLGCNPIIMTLGPITPGKPPANNPTGQPSESYQEVTIDGLTPMFSGWSLVATIEPRDNGEMMIREVPGQSCPESFRTTTVGRCDHCNAQRRRSMMIVVKNEAGEHKQLGRQCVADFLGGVSPDELLARMSWIAELEEAKTSSRGGLKGNLVVETLDFLTAVCAAVEVHGWMAKSQCSEWQTPTVSRAWGVFQVVCNGEIPSAEVREYLKEHGDAMRAKAAMVMAWARGLTGGNGYEYALGVAARQDVVQHKDGGILASAVSGYDRVTTQEIQNKIAAERAARNAVKAIVSQHVGEVGTRSEFHGLTVAMVRLIDSDYGVRSVIKFVDEAGNVLIWFATGATELEKGQTLSIKATVKEHSEYQGVKQTIVTRAKVLAAVAVAA